MMDDAFGNYSRKETPKLNVLLLEETVNWAIDSYNQSLESIFPTGPYWSQGTWAGWSKTLSQKNENYCGTSFCIAGKAVHASGNTAIVHNEIVVADTIIGFNQTEAVASDLPWSQAGALVLGLTDFEAHKLFSGANTIHDVARLATQIAAHRGEKLHLHKIDRY